MSFIAFTELFSHLFTILLPTMLIDFPSHTEIQIHPLYAKMLNVKQNDGNRK